MPVTLWTDQDANPDVLKSGPIAVLGYGSQGRAHALNLRDSGFDVLVGLRPDGASADKARADGFDVKPMAEAAERGKLIALLAPDMALEAIFEEAVRPNLQAHDALLFAHGFAIQYGRVRPSDDIDVVMVAPKGPGDLVRREYERGQGVPALRAVHQDASGKAGDKALAYAWGLGGTRAGVIDTTFQEETETDLFGEQAVLCGGLSELILAGYETLIEAGYQPEVAYFECLHEVKLIVDLLHEGGLAKMHEFISETAKYGDFVSGPRVVNAETKARMKEVLTDIQNGGFARDWILENQAGRPRYMQMWAQDENHPIEKVGRELRARMPWLNPGGANR